MDPSLFTSVINSYLPEPHASLMNGILFGIPLHTDKTFITNLKVVGLIHIVVLSGMNITLLCSIVGSLTRNFSKNISILIMILFTLLFVGFVGIQAPIVRAAFMNIFTLVAVVLGKKSHALVLLIVSSLIMIAIWPDWLTSISFQLSIGATLGLILFSQPSLPTSNTLLSTLKSYMISEFRTSLSAQVFTVPLIFIYFKQISLISPLANIAISWLIAPLMVLGFATVFIGKISYLLGAIPALLCFGLLQIIVWTTSILAHIPFANITFQK
ncbi:ComEC/Rec2 family competence protein [Candidatus Roizmanbacteria bacterium]|nr:ComEC/Rec2 family competence protein [Candidatus Roizmanbacteria bacterium]